MDLGPPMGQQFNQPPPPVAQSSGLDLLGEGLDSLVGGKVTDLHIEYS